MKQFNYTFICILICLVPTLLAGQALQVQKQLPGIQAPSEPFLSSPNQLTDPPLLRISNIGSSGQDGVSIELIPLSLMSTGPMLLLDSPVPGTPASGAIRLSPNVDGTKIKVSNIGSSGQDGVRLSFVPPPVLNSFFDVFYNTTTGTETHHHGDPDFDLLRITTYDKATPKLLERVSSNSIGLDSFFDVFYDLSLASHGIGFGNNPDNLCFVRTYDKATPKLLEKVSSSSIGVDSFFDVFYDLSLAKHGIGFGNNPDNLCMVTTYDKATPKLWERVSSNSIGLDSFFDVFYDLSLAKHGIGFGNNPDNLCMVTTYDKATPKLWERVSSNSIGLDSFFDVFYDLSLASHGIGFGNNPDNLCMVSMYDPMTPKLTQKISSGLPAVHSFFDITYDLSIGQEAHRLAALPGDPDFDLLLIRDYDRATPKLHDRILSTKPEFVNSFFDIFYDIQLAKIGRGFGNNPNNICAITTFDPLTPKIQERIESSLLPYVESFFDITYDLDLGIHSIKHRGLVNSIQYNESEWDFVSRLSSEDPSVQSFFDITYDIGLSDIQSHSTRAGLMGSEPMEMRYEYDALNRKIRQVGTDTQNGSTLSLEWLLGPTGSSLLVSDKLQVQGTLSTSGGGPLVLEDNLMVIGASHQINGMLTVNGNFQVNGVKMFKIDHPLDPHNKYLVHSCIESPDMMNIYNGNAITDNQGYVTIKLPDYFEALNADFRYQLTCIGQFAQAIVEQKINHNQFVIRTDKPNVEVSWQVTGIRHDPAALQQQYQVEVEKTMEEKESGFGVICKQ